MQASSILEGIGKERKTKKYERRSRAQRSVIRKRNWQKPARIMVRIYIGSKEGAATASGKVLKAYLQRRGNADQDASSC